MVEPLLNIFLVSPPMSPQFRYAYISTLDNQTGALQHHKRNYSVVMTGSHSGVHAIMIATYSIGWLCLIEVKIGTKPTQS